MAKTQVDQINDGIRMIQDAIADANIYMTVSFQEQGMVIQFIHQLIPGSPPIAKIFSYADMNNAGDTLSAMMCINVKEVKNAFDELMDTVRKQVAETYGLIDASRMGAIH